MLISPKIPQKSFFYIKLKHIYLTCFLGFIISYSCLGLAFSSFNSLVLIFYASIIALTAGYYFVHKKVLRDPFVPATAVFFYIYLFWFFLSVCHNNNLVYIFQDSVGFLFYLAYLPLSFILIKFSSDLFYENLICYIGLAAALLHITLFGLYFLVMGSSGLNGADVDAFNLMLQSIGFTKDLGGAYGLLRIDIGIGQLLIIPFAISVKNILKAKKITECKSQLSFAVILLIGAIFNGNRSLLLTLALALFLLLIFSIRYHRIAFQKLLKFCFAFALVITLFLLLLNLSGLYDLSMLSDRLITALTFDHDDDSNRMRYIQFFSLIDKISESPLMGSGFGAFADVIRNDERPFMYEVDYLAVIMKLGIFGASLYIGTYIYVLVKGYKLLHHSFDRAVPYVSAGAAYLFYMGANGGFAMSVFSTLLHLMIMLGIANSLKVRTVLID